MALIKSLLTCLALFPLLPHRIAAAQPDLAWSPEPIILSDETAAALCRAAHAALLGHKTAGDALPPQLQKDPADRVVFLSVSDGRSPARVACARGKGLPAALSRASQQLAQSLRSEHAANKNPKTLWLKLDIVQQTFPLPDLRPSAFLTRRPSLRGIAFDWSAQLAWLPEELAAHNAMPARGPIWIEDLLKLARTRPGDTARFQEILGKKPLPAARFKTSAYFYENDRAVPLYRGHRTWRTITDAHLRRAARYAGEYLRRAVRPDGTFVYIYYPVTGRRSPLYNVVRHAGAVMALLELYQVTRDDRLLAPARLALDALQRMARPFGPPDRNMACFVKQDGAAGLGGPALAVLALAQHQLATGDPRYRPFMIRLANYVADCVLPDGSFISRRDVATGKAHRWQSAYYPGEAVFALVRLYQIDNRPRWLETALRGAAWLIHVRDKNIPAGRLIHDHWLLYALNELHRVKPDPVFVEHAMRIARAIQLSQQVRGESPDWLGAFSVPPRATPAATRNEGLLAAYRLLRNAGRQTAANDIMETVHLAMAFQLQMQFLPETAMYLRDPARALGGVRPDFQSLAVRIDYCQHFLSSTLALYRILREEKRSELACPKVLKLLDQRNQTAFPWRK